eukprot:gi/632934079/ref/XP_007898813.1/ PREDICTED: mucin-4 [Callorhinchus milii]
MQNRFPDAFGSGVRCYYSFFGGLIYGEKERFLPTPWIYYNWWIWWWRGYYYSYWNNFWNNIIPAHRQQYKVNEIDPYNDCCRDSGSYSYCSLYREKRPRNFCFGYIPPRIGFFFGDPHVVSLDNVKYTFNGLGEFILLNVKDESNTVIFALQGRTIQAGENMTSEATNFVALAAQGPSGTKVQWNLVGDEINVLLDGMAVNVTENSTYINQVTLQTTSNNETVATFEGGTSVTVSGTKGALTFTTFLDNDLKNKTEGLLGVWNDDATDDFKAANGTYLNFDGKKLPSDNDIFFDFGLTWKTTENNTLFTYNSYPGETWYTYNNNSFVPKFYDELLNTTDKEKINKANETCKGNDDCIFDILSTDDFSFGAATLQSITSFGSQNSTMNNFPPNITGNSVFETRLDEPVFFIFSATDLNDDKVIFSVLTDSADISMTENGNFTWHPTSATPVFVIVQANDSKAVAELGLTLILCNCSINSTCDYSGSILTIDRNNSAFQISMCNCSEAYTGDYCTEDFDGCEDNQCFLNDTCKDQPAPQEGYTCDPCPDYLQGDGLKCYDLDECLENISSCQQICTNVFGGYNCSCNEGYEIDQSNSSLCADIDECNNASTCPQNADCTNTMGNYSCSCKTGYNGEPYRFCIDINECLNINKCSAISKSTCSNTDGSFHCTCLQGYEGAQCADIDECTSNRSNCVFNSDCLNTVGSYTCMCNTGYEGPNCIDIDECAKIQDNCHKMATCNNTAGSFKCSCMSGFQGNGTFCEDIDECADTSETCSSNEVCENSFGNYACKCLPGYERVNGSCQDIDECQNTNKCSETGQLCVNIEASYKCGCKTGFVSNSGICKDIDECSLSETNNCSKSRGLCANLEGSYVCQCLAGYSGDGIVCNDITGLGNLTTIATTPGANINTTVPTNTSTTSATNSSSPTTATTINSTSPATATTNSTSPTTATTNSSSPATVTINSSSPTTAIATTNSTSPATAAVNSSPTTATTISTSGAATIQTTAGTTETTAGRLKTTAGTSKTTAGTTETTAGTSKTTAGTTETTAGTSKTTAGTSETTAGTSKPIAGTTETTAGTSKTTAGTSKTTAGTSKTTAGTIEATAGTSKTTAGTSKPIAGTSKPIAGTTETIAGTTKTTAGTIETTAGTTETTAGTSKTTAGTIEATAGTSETTAGTSKPIAGTTETTAGTSKTTAGTTETTAGTSKTTAGTSKTTAGTIEATAGTSKTTAGTSKPIAGTSKPIAGTTETIAGTTKTTAGTIETTAGTIETTAGTTETTAGTSKTTAGTIEATAGTSKTTAGTSKPIAGTSKPIAGTTETIAGTTETIAGTTKTTAGTIETTADTTETTAGTTETTAGTSKTTAGTSKTTAGTSKTTAGTSKTTAGTSKTTAGTTKSTAGTTKTTSATTTLPSTSGGGCLKLLDYGVEFGDQTLTTAASDVTSPIFKPEIGFPMGNSLQFLLYFTDNGLIVFPSAESEVYRYTNPFSGGFTASSTIPMIAAFWADADLSAGATVFYQEYHTYRSESPSLIQRVEGIIKKYFEIQYKAKWTLKITWDKIPAFPASQLQSKTNTFQAVLSTDGSQSFVLIFYKCDGMNWDVSTLVSTNVLIGFNSGDGYFENDKQTELTVTERYRPDKYIGTNTDLKGLWAYKLIEGSPQKNYRAECLNWFLSEPDPANWNQALFSCPCTFNQGQAENRFRKFKSDASTKLLRPTGPNAFNASLRCIYNRKNALIEGWQERYWVSFRQITSLTNNQKFDLDPYNWCCIKVDDPLFCSYYEMKRPKDMCQGYRAPTAVLALGDPHFTTIDGLNYTFNGLGDYVLVNVQDSSTKTIFKLHGRTGQTGSAKATNFMAFAAQHLSTKNTTLQIILKDNESINAILNDQNVTFVLLAEDTSKEIYEDGAFSLEKSASGSTITATFDGGISLTATAKFAMLTIAVFLPEDYLNKTEGLFGLWNRDPNDDLKMPNGTIIPINSTESAIFDYGRTWTVPTDRSLFTATGLSTSHNDSFRPVFMEDIRKFANFGAIAIVCKNNTQCIFDSLTTGNEEIGLATASQISAFAIQNSTLRSFPPFIEGNQVIRGVLLQKITSYFTATEGTFTAIISQDLNLTANGTLTWIPRSTDGFFLEIEATGSNNASSVVHPRLVLCNCNNNGECNFNETLRINGSSVYKASCRCQTGFSGSECQTETNECQIINCFPGANCNDSSGCGPCPAGLSGNGEQCTDIDECNDMNPCSQNATCTNLIRSYNCSCHAGFSGNGTTCAAILCDSSPCPASYCDNGVTCIPEPTNACSPSCECPPQYQGDRCSLPTSQFMAEPLSTIPQRRVNITLRLINFNSSILSNQSSADLMNKLTREKVLKIMSNIPRFDSNMEPVFWALSGRIATAVASSFNYNGNKTIIDFLNDELINEIIKAFNKQRSRRSLQDETVDFETVNRDDIQDVKKVLQYELLSHFSCNNTVFAGYVVQWDEQDGVVCRSPCDMDHCLNEAKCQHLPTGPQCICIPRTIYSTFGDRCEHLSMNLRAFFGILFGALAFLLLLLLAIFLIVWKCKTSKRQQLINDTSSTGSAGNTTFSWQKNAWHLTSKMESTSILPSANPKNLSSVSWKPHLSSVNLAKISIQRPSLNKNDADSGQ